MAAYAALVSLFNTLDQIKNHPRFSNSLDKYQIESLGSHIDFLIDFVETYNIDGDLSKGAQELRSQIVSAAHEAEDIVESHIVNLILPESAESSDVRLHHRCLFGLQKVIQDMDSTKEKVLKFKEEKPSTNVMHAASSTLLTPEQNSMVGFDDELKQLMDVLIAQQSSRQIVSIVGMGGSGKTTLAKHVYQDSLTVHHFDLRAWATISQEYDVIDILLHLLSETGGTLDELGEKLHKKLFGIRYLIVLDDIWDMEVWNRLKFFFPDNGDGSRIVLTTRLSNIPTQLGSICFKINFLDGDRSWNLFCQKIFGQENCPVELEGIGKEIVEHCKGLPLSIVVIGGILRKSPRTKGYWQSVAQNMNAILNSIENGQCLDVLHLSYSHLPAHLKPCFLYLGTFKEDSEIRVSEIIRLWVAEGFLKPNDVQILEEMAEDYLKDLMDRNLILVCVHRSNGRIKSFRIHDLLRELCLRVADKEEFFYMVKPNSIPQVIGSKRRLIFQSSVTTEICKALQSTSLARSLVCEFAEAQIKFRFLRVLNEASYSSLKAKFLNVNLRYVACKVPTLPSSISLVWNLQTLVIDSYQIVAPLEIWKLTQLRHIKVDRISIPDPPPSHDKDDSVVLGKLHTLALVTDFILSEEACKRIPNIRKLCIRFDYPRYNCSWYGELQNLGRLQSLESVYLEWYCDEFPISILKNAFPSSLKKLYLEGAVAYLNDMSIIIGSLPQLEVLKLKGTSASWSQKWSCVEGRFFRLKYLSIEECYLKSWTLNSASCFPVLEKLVLKNMEKLKEIPLDIGEIPTLQLIRLENCITSLVISAMKIKEEQESFGNYDIRIQGKMYLWRRKALMKRVKAVGLSIKNIDLESDT